MKTSLLSGSLNIAGLCSDDTALLCKLFMEGKIILTSYPSEIGMVQLLTTEHSTEKILSGDSVSGPETLSRLSYNDR